MRCLSSAKLNMLADVIKIEGSPEVTTSGHWEYIQDPDSGAVEHVWVDTPDDPNTPGVIEGGRITGVPCSVRSIIGKGIGGQGNTERFDNLYQNIDWVKMTFPLGYGVSKRDRVTRIRDLQGNILWVEEELDGKPATTFNVMGVTPIINGFGRAAEFQALLKRAEVQ